jgi:Flp pilus assembly protein TadD
LAATGDFAAASVEYESAIALGDHDPLILAASGVAMLKLGRGEDAVRRLRQAVASAPTDAQFRAFLEDAERETGIHP